MMSLPRVQPRLAIEWRPPPRSSDTSPCSMLMNDWLQKYLWTLDTTDTVGILAHVWRLCTEGADPRPVGSERGLNCFNCQRPWYMQASAHESEAVEPLIWADATKNPVAAALSLS